MARRAPLSVDEFLSSLVHGRLDEVLELRRAIVASNEPIEERVKWNAPSFGRCGLDRVTFRLAPGDRIELVFHLGAGRPAPDQGAVAVDDPRGVLRWLAEDRAVVSIVDRADMERKLPDVVRLVGSWLAATT